MPEDARKPLPRVAAILVVHDAEERLPAVLSTLAAQDYPALDLVVVDNASGDGSPEILRQAVAEQRRVTLPRNAGFPGAVHAAMGHDLVRDAEYVLLVHDDLLLSPDAVSRMVDSMQADTMLAATGPKLREWSEERILQQVGMTVDRLGRAESGIEPGELDQGQADQPRDVLYVSTAGMLLRTAALADLGGFDPRMPAMRDDLDYCWRAWLAGWRVGVEPAAVGYHAAAGARGARPLWRSRPTQVSYLDERHALAAVLKCSGLLRLLWIVPVLVLFGVAKVVVFALTRRFGAAGATLRAYAWNLAALPSTLRLRRQVQRGRVRSDAELRPLLAAGLARSRHGDAVREWIAGEDTPAMIEDDAFAPDRPVHDTATSSRWVTEHPVGAAGFLLAVAYLVGLAPLLGAGQLVGGDVLPWPAEVTALLEGYVSGASGEPLASAAAPSPIQAVLGAVGLLGFGSAWAAQRLVVFGLLPLAWLTALRAGRLVTSRATPRVLGATLYVLSPPVLATLARGRLGELVVAALLPAIVLLTARAAGPTTRRATAWRATALLVLVSAIAIAASPGAGLAVVVVLVAGAVVAVWPGLDRNGRPALRMVTAVLGTGLLLAPWLVSLAGVNGATLPPAPAAEMPAWRALALVPDELLGAPAVLEVIAAAVTGAVVVLALVLGLRLRPLPVTALVAALVGSSALAWGAAQEAPAWVWPPGLLLGGALAAAGLGVVATRTLGPAVRERAFGVVQVVVVLGALVLLTGLGTGTWRVAAGPWDAIDSEVELVPPFVGGDEERVGPYRVVLLDVDDAGVLRWAVTGADGPRIDTFGTVASPVLSAHLQQSLARVVAGDPDAGADLGRLNVRYAVLTDAAREAFEEPLLRQPDLEPLAAGGGGVLRVQSWLPRAALLPEETAEAVLSAGSPGDLAAVEGRGVPRPRAGLYRGAPAGGGVLLVAEEPGRWVASADGSLLPSVPAAAEVPVAAFEVPDDAAVLSVRPAGAFERLLMVGLEAMVVLVMVSLLLRPPGLAEARKPPAALRGTPAALRGATAGDRGDAVAGATEPPPQASGGAGADDAEGVDGEDAALGEERR